MNFEASFAAPLSNTKWMLGWKVALTTLDPCLQIDAFVPALIFLSFYHNSMHICIWAYPFCGEHFQHGMDCEEKHCRMHHILHGFLKHSCTQVLYWYSILPSLHLLFQVICFFCVKFSEKIVYFIAAMGSMKTTNARLTICPNCLPLHYPWIPNLNRALIIPQSSTRELLQCII